MHKLKNIIIFIDSYNDVDHILPFIDYVLLNQKAKIILYRAKKSDLSGCVDHLKYLQTTYGLIPVNYDQFFSKKYTVFMNVYWKLLAFSNRAKQNSYLLLFLILVSRLRFVVIYLTRQEVNRVQENINADIIMMDNGKETSLYGSAIVKYAQNKSIATVGYLHGFSIYTNTDTLQKDKIVLNPVKKLILRLSKPAVIPTYFDRYVTGIRQKKSFFSSSQMPHFEECYLSRVLEVGMPRFSKEWIFKYKEKVIRSQGFTYGDTNKINVILFMSHPQYNVLADELMATIKILSSCNTINFVYKPHTRNGLDRINLKKLNGYDASKVSSLELSSWADVGIVYGSSVEFQLLNDDVPLIMPKYLHLNTTIFEENNVCIVVNNINEMISIFSKTKKEISDMIIRKNVSKFIRNYVYGGNDYSSLMKDFYRSSVGFK